MSDSVKKVLFFVVALVVGWWALKTVVVLALALVFKIIIPLAVLGVIGYGLYSMFGKKALGSGNRRSLP